MSLTHARNGIECHHHRFNVRPEIKASQTAEKEALIFRLYNIIYEAIDDVKKALEAA